MAVNRVLTNGAIDLQFNFPVRRLNLRLPQSDVPRHRVELKVRDILSHTSLVLFMEVSIRRLKADELILLNLKPLITLSI